MLSRALAVFEPLAIFALIMVYIWDLRFRLPWLWVLILGLMVFSHVMRRERPAALGFRATNLRECLRRYGPWIGLVALLLVACGMMLHTVRRILVGDALRDWAFYVPWGLCQQYMLNGYFFIRFKALVGPTMAPMVVVALFSMAHLPNWFLMAAALAGGYASVRVYRETKNLYFLGLAHAAVGFLVFLVVPDSVTHHLRVGPGWYRF